MLRCARAFTLIELLVVFVVLGVLAAVSYVSYAAVSKKTSNTGPQRAIRAVAAAEDAAYLRDGAFVGSSSLPSLESAYSYTSGPATGSVVSVQVGTDTQGSPVVGLAALGVGGSCFEMLVYPPTSSSSNLTGTLAAGSSCTGQSALSPTGASW